jgi:hypothetical protein
MAWTAVDEVGAVRASPTHLVHFAAATQALLGKVGLKRFGILLVQRVRRILQSGYVPRSACFSLGRPALSVINKSYLYTVAGIALLIIGLVVAFQNSDVVTGVSIKLIPGTKEHRDHSLGAIGKEHELPDYHVKLNVHRRLSNIDLGRRLNVSAADWLDFPVSDRVYVRRLQEIIIMDDDKMENDILDRFPISSSGAKGTKYECKVTSATTWDGGLGWFVRDPAGLGLLIASLALITAGPVASRRKSNEEFAA